MKTTAAAGNLVGPLLSVTVTYHPNRSHTYTHSVNSALAEGKYEGFDGLGEGKMGGEGKGGDGKGGEGKEEEKGEVDPATTVATRGPYVHADESVAPTQTPPTARERLTNAMEVDFQLFKWVGVTYISRCKVRPAQTTNPPTIPDALSGCFVCVVPYLHPCVPTLFCVACGQDANISQYNNAFDRIITLLASWLSQHRDEAAAGPGGVVGPGARITHTEQGTTYERVQGLREDYEGQVSPIKYFYVFFHAVLVPHCVSSLSSCLTSGVVGATACVVCRCRKRCRGRTGG
jgi:hypothetical protein